MTLRESSKLIRTNEMQYLNISYSNYVIRMDDLIDSNEEQKVIQ